MLNNRTILFKFLVFYFSILVIVVILIIFNERKVSRIFNNKIQCYPIRLVSKQKYYTLDNQTFYPKSLQLHQNKSIDFDCLKQNKKTKIILFWTKFYGIHHYYLTFSTCLFLKNVFSKGKNDHAYGLGKKTPFIKHKCPVTNCELTNNRSMIAKADFVIVHITELTEKLNQLPVKRPPNQRWIFLMFESPLYKPDYSQFNGFFNLTSTYTIDSNFPGGNLMLDRLFKL